MGSECVLVIKALDGEIIGIISSVLMNGKEFARSLTRFDHIVEQFARHYNGAEN